MCHPGRCQDPAIDERRQLRADKRFGIVAVPPKSVLRRPPKSVVISGKNFG
jgi:hypothetical protein